MTTTPWSIAMMGAGLVVAGAVWWGMFFQGSIRVWQLIVFSAGGLLWAWGLGLAIPSRFARLRRGALIYLGFMTLVTPLMLWWMASEVH
jgi:hypothetical protein